MIVITTNIINNTAIFLGIFLDKRQTGLSIIKVIIKARKKGVSVKINIFNENTIIINTETNNKYLFHFTFSNPIFDLPLQISSFSLSFLY